VLDSVYQPLTDTGGAVTGILVHGVDLTDRVRAQERLRANEAWLQTVTDTLPALVSYIDTDLVYRFVNRAYEEWFGTPAATVVGKTVGDVLGEENFEQRRPYLEAVLRGEAVRFEGPTDHARLGRRETEVIYTPYRPDGTVAGFFVHGVDITERRAVERAKREAERRLDLAVEVAQMGTFEIDLATDAVTVNEPGREIYGWDGVHTTFARVQAHFHPDDKDRVLAAVAAALDPAGPGTFEVEQRILRTDRAERWIRVRGRALFSGAGADRRAVRCIGAYLDVTEARRREEALKEADRRKDEFLALLAHELRNPLAPIRNGLQVLRLAEGSADTARRARDMMDRQLTHLVRLVDDLLDVSRITRGKLDLRRERVALADVLASAVETAKPALDAAGHALTVSVPPAPLYLDGDLTRLAQVFANLLTNSAKYTPPGGDVRLTVARDGDAAVVRVTDNGSGIPPDSLPRIFDMFNQVDRLVERTTGGLGIGLALVKGLVEMHGGTVAAASEGEGRGSTFTVRLPLSPQQPPPPAPANQSNGVTTNGPGRKILVVDDNRDSAQSMADMLKLLGHDVRTAHDGTDAVVVAEAFRPDLILMDVGMPTMNGLDATRAVRGRPWGRNVTILALTGWGQDADRAESRRAGCDDHLVKPVALEALEPFLTPEQKP
jgi:PAS domain S-box-containing protein